MSELTLYVDRFRISPYAFSAYVALVEKALPFAIVELGLDRRDHLEASYQAGSITGRIPSLREGDFWLAESSAIAEYLEDTHPTPRILPSDAHERARCRQVMAWVRSDLMPIREERPTHTIFYARAQRSLSVEAGKAVARLVKAADALVPDGRTTMFADWCLADADLGLMLLRLLKNGDALPEKLRAYAEAQLLRPSVKSWMEHVRPPYESY